MTELRKIMLVENEDEIREIATMCLGDLGKFEIVSCASGQDAIEKFPTEKPQLIMMDVMMPGMSGLQAFEKIKTLPGGKEVPVVFVTARAHKVQIEEYMQAGAAGVIAKPFDPITIINEISAIWEKHTSAT